ncbi:hypothetical protein [Phenylobacterium sp.]|uniref:hypothetical protein n=1 Tax=Phenylobacterium sp. TaxID=1871053 RepID=UPI00301C3D15
MKIRQLSMILSAAVMATAAIAAAAEAQDRAADWVRRPTSDDLLAVWPSKALQQGYGGNALLACIATLHGTLRDCRVESETPAGGGFGSAALILSRQFVLRPAVKDGVPVESQVRIPINFPKPDRATGSHIRPTTASDLPGRVVYRQLRWTKAPTFADVRAAYPAKAQADKVGGSATLGCRIGRDGRLSACEIVREAPERYGFGVAARRLAPLFETPVQTDGGRSVVGGYAHLNVTFAAASIDAPDPVIGRPEWVSLPNIEDMSAVVPEAAKARKVFKARAVINCQVGASGDLETCGVQSEEPAALGYGDAALALSRRFRLAIWTDEGLPIIGGAVRVPIRFDLDDYMRSASTPAAAEGAPAP